MKVYTLHQEQFLATTIEKAWDFFSSPLNLQKITPPGMGFVVHTDVTGTSIYENMQISYTVRPLMGIPLKWVTRIGKVDAPYSFVDTQLRGPYALWEHTHIFEKVDGGVKMTDTVRYALPAGPIGMLMHALVVRKKLEHIFNYRRSVLNDMFGS